MTAIEKLQDKLNIEIDDVYKYNMYDLEVSTYNTADGYEVYVMNSTPFENGLDWENDVYYYEPQFDTIMDRIEETCHDLGYGEEVKIYIDTEAFLPEQEVIEWLEQKED